MHGGYWYAWRLLVCMEAIGMHGGYWYAWRLLVCIEADLPSESSLVAIFLCVLEVLFTAWAQVASF
jgi:hypothetical protein